MSPSKVFRDTDGDKTSFKTNDKGKRVEEQQVGQSGNVERVDVPHCAGKKTKRTR